MTDVIDPKWVRVSSILRMMPTLLLENRWGYPIDAIDSSILEKKSEIGSNVHEAIAEHIKGEFYILSDREQGYFDSYLKWEKSVSLECHMTEKRYYYEPMNLTGCIDMIGKINPGGLPQLIDFKCTVAADHVKWPIQAAFYYLLTQFNGMKLDPNCLFIQLDKEGKAPKVHRYEITKELTSTAISLYNTYMYLTRKYQ